jgi:hypothetical protein
MSEADQNFTLKFVRSRDLGQKVHWKDSKWRTIRNASSNTAKGQSYLYQSFNRQYQGLSQPASKEGERVVAK